MSRTPLGFIPEPIMLMLNQLLPSRQTPPGVLGSRKFKQIVASIETIGLIEPLNIGQPVQAVQAQAVDAQPAQAPASATYILLDGHIRLLALRQLGYTDAPCLVARDNESYTYNNRVNRISSIQEHHMLRRAVARGVTPERLAQALNVDVSSIQKKVGLLDGICPEVIDRLKDRHFSANLGAVLRKMVASRQIVCVDLMLAANNLTVTYANALLATTPPKELVNAYKARKLRGFSADQIATMAHEVSHVQARLKLAEQSYGPDTLTLILARGYLAKLINNPAAFRYLSQRQPEMLAAFESIVQTEALAS